jgi:hypothetical protein
MRTSHQLQRRAVVIWAIGFVIVSFWVSFGGLGGEVAVAKTAKKDKTEAAAASSKAPPGVTLNACGCYRRGEACMCTNKNARCDCPGDCEPVGCDEKRQKEMDREVAAEVKRAEDADKKRAAAEAESERKAAEAEAARQKAEEDGDDDTTVAPEDRAAVEKPADKAQSKSDDKATDKPATKPAHKGRASKKSARPGS